MEKNVCRNTGFFLRCFGIVLAACLVLTLLGCRHPVSSSKITVNSVKVFPSSIMVYKGETKQFYAVVLGTNNPAPTVTWAVEGGGDGTSIISNGLLTVATDESAATLTVRATSTLNTGKSGTATVTVDTPPLAGAVIISGAAREGYALSANTDNLHGTGTISYQWKKADTAEAEGTNITGANDRAYELVAADVNKFISVTVSRTGYSGFITSDAVGQVEASSGSTGTVNGTVTVSNGIDNVSVSFTNTGSLTLSKTGTLTITVDGLYQAYRWYVDGVALNDEPFASIELKGEDYAAGDHRVLVIVYKDGVPFSQEIRFTVPEAI
jgi:hypothetical protein